MNICCCCCFCLSTGTYFKPKKHLKSIFLKRFLLQIFCQAFLDRGATSKIGSVCTALCPGRLKSEPIEELKNTLCDVYTEQSVYTSQGPGTVAQYMCTHSRNIGMSVNFAVGCMQGSVVLYHGLLHGSCFIFFWNCFLLNCPFLYFFCVFGFWPMK